ncbi:MAG: cardiolipin synthase [Candidatus Omnitrophica bacterium]|nr:cardiolipin synthase [Candidatus Omnitrophota bacterium]
MMSIAPALIILFQLYLIFTVVVLLLDNRTPSETFAWILIFILMPGLGLGLYLMFGRNWKRSYNHKIKLPQSIAKELSDLFKPLVAQQAEVLKQMKNKTSIYHDDLMTLLFQSSNALLTTGNKAEIFHNGKDKFDRLKQDLQNAKAYIHMEYFIWYSKDKLGQEIKDILIAKAQEGVEVRILYDYSGCFLTLSQKYINELRVNKVQIYPFFNYLSNFKMHTLNYRNHRKIVSIDGRIGYTGGVNVGQEYIDGGKRYGSWRDTHIRLEGQSVSVLQAIFAVDWYNTVEKADILDAKYFPLLTDNKPVDGNLSVQLTTSGFDSPWPSILQLYFTLITMAQRNIYIVSPYFVPDETLLMALKTAAMRGVKVAIMTTGVADNPVPYWAAFSYFEDLLKAGVRIFQYEKGFMHAKIYSSDGKVCSIGSANFDIRSLQLNYEVNAVFYDDDLTQQVDAQIMEDLKHCKEVLVSDLKQSSVLARLRNSLVRLISGIL